MYNLLLLSTADSEEPDEMPHYEVLHCLLRQKRLLEKNNFIWKL